jgi:hypothetical protein
MSRSKGPTAYSTLKMMGFAGTRQAVLDQLDIIRNQLVGENV